MKQFFKHLFDDNNTINEKAVVGFIDIIKINQFFDCHQKFAGQRYLLG
jgi:hypothetical protein